MKQLLTLGLLLSTTSFASVIVTFDGAPTGVNDGADYVTPYLLTVGAQPYAATCYDIYDEVTLGQTWTANVLNVNQAGSFGQFSNEPDALFGYEEIGFLALQPTPSAQDQIDLQHDIWNVFAPNTYAVTPGMQTYLDLISTAAFQNFNFDRVEFLEDVNQSTGRAQAFVIDPPVTTPEPASCLLTFGGIAALFCAWKTRRRSSEA